jgi:peroxiredoxin
MKTRVEELTVRLLDGLITDAEFKELERLMADPGSADTLAGLMELEGLLRGLRSPDVSPAILERVRRERAGRIEGRIMERVRQLPAPQRAGASRAWLAASIAAGVLFVLTLTGLWTMRPQPRPSPTEQPLVRDKAAAPLPPPAPPEVVIPSPKPAPLPKLSSPPSVPSPAPAPAPVVPSPEDRPPVPAPGVAPPQGTQAVAEAALERVEGEVALLEGTIRTPAVPGAVLRAGRTVVTSGRGSRAAVVWPDRTKVELDPDTRLTRLEDAAGARSLSIEKGSVSISTGAPMTVRTAQAEARILGTRFTVAATATVTQLSVQEGKVRFTRLADGAWADVPAGFFAVAGPGPRPLAQAINPPSAGVPELSGSGWVNADDCDLERFRGKVVVLFFFEGIATNVQALSPGLNELAAKYEGKPVMFLAVSGGHPLSFARDYAASTKLQWPILADPLRETEKRYGQKISLANCFWWFVIDPEGKTSSSLGADQRAVEARVAELLPRARMVFQDLRIPGELDWAARQIEQGKLVPWIDQVFVRGFREKADDATLAMCKRLESGLQALAEEAERDEQAGRPYDAYRKWLRISEVYKITADGKRGREAARKLGSDPQVKKELAARQLYDAIVKAIEAKKKDTEIRAIAEQVALLRKQYPQTEAGKKADVLEGAVKEMEAASKPAKKP